MYETKNPWLRHREQQQQQRHRQKSKQPTRTTPSSDALLHNRRVGQYTKVNAQCDKLAAVSGLTKLTILAMVDVPWQKIS